MADSVGAHPSPSAQDRAFVPSASSPSVSPASAASIPLRKIYPIDAALALKAHKLSRKSQCGKEMGQALRVSTDDANTLAAVGRALANIEAARLSDGELSLILTLAALEREGLPKGDIASPKGKRVSWRLRKSEGWCASVGSKRLDYHRKGESEHHRGTGLGLVRLSRNGHVWLTSAGWALVHAYEAGLAKREAA